MMRRLAALGLKVRITVLLLVLFMSSLWGVVYLVAERLEDDTVELLANQQLSTASYIARDIDANVVARLGMLKESAERLPAGITGNHSGAAAYLAGHSVLSSVFTVGVVLFDRQGRVVADYPPLPERAAASYQGYDFIEEVLQTGGPAIGKPRIGRFSRQPIIVMAVPVRNAEGDITGILAGLTSLSDPTLFGAIERAHFGKTGWVAVNAPRHGIIVTCSDPSRILTPLALPGVNQMLDRFIAGYEGSGVAVNSRGMETLTSARRVPSAGWIVQAVLPTDEAFAPIRTMKSWAYGLAAAFSAFIAVLVWWLIWRALRPLDRTTGAIQAMVEGSGQLDSLPAAGQDEVGRLVTQFNRLIEQRQAMERELRRSSDVWDAIQHAITESLILIDTAGCIQSANPTAAERLGVQPGQAVGCNVFALLPPEAAERRRGFIEEVIRAGTPMTQVDRRGAFDFSTTYYPVRNPQGQVTAVAIVATDVTAQCRAEEERDLMASVFTNSGEAILITDARACIVKVNAAFTRLTGYREDEVVGHNPRMLSAGRTPPAVFADMWHQLGERGTWEGELWDRRKTGEAYPKWISISVIRNPAGEVTHYIGSFTDITERKASEERVRELAHYDALTRLPNRFSLHERLEQALATVRRDACQLALMLIDLDQFKGINDTLGHHTGDQLLIQVAGRLTHSVRDSDIVARLGGDEFVIVLPGIDSSTDAAIVAEKIVQAVSEPYRLDGRELRTSPSIGICIYPDDAQEIADLLKNADVAMYHAKADGRGRYRFFTAEMNVAALRRMGMEADLRRALEQGEFELYYQPQVNLPGRRLLGFEALLRWRHPEQGLVSPADFIPVAEETGLIVPLSEWVLQEACRQALAWQAEGLAGLGISVNISARQFQEAGFVRRVAAVLAETGLPARCLDLEVTESMAMRSPEDSIRIMRELSDMGVSWSIDDFGTGYSSLAYLKLFPIQTLKIDRSFVKDIEKDANDAAICDTTIALAHKLGLRVVAEGVETETQLAFLQQAGCQAVQGYLLSRPLPAAMAAEFARRILAEATKSP